MLSAKQLVRVLDPLDGAGRCTAEVVVAYLDNPQRFENGRQVSAYAVGEPRRTRFRWLDDAAGEGFMPNPSQKLRTDVFRHTFRVS